MADLISPFLATRDFTETLAEPLSPEDQTVQSMPDVSPTKWHRAHTTWFFEEFLLGPHAPGHTPFHDDYRFLFNSYYEAVGPRHSRAHRGLISRPNAAEIGEYRAAVDGAVVEFLRAGVDDTIERLVELGINHEQQHQELLLMDAKHVLWSNPTDPAYLPVPPPRADTPPPMRWIGHGGGIVEIGADAGFHFDSEAPRHATLLVPFELASRPVTNAEWFDFVADGGYRDARLWLSDGWAWVQSGHDAPLYWRNEDGDSGADLSAWTQFTLAGRRALDPHEPVSHISYYEADAYAAWAGARLPREAEWETIHAKTTFGDALDRDVLAPRFVGSDDGLAGGGVWEWTASPYSAYPGFKAAEGAVGEYNGKFMVNQQVLRGRSCLTPDGHSRPTYRNFFPASSRWITSGVRLARELSS